MRVNDAITGFVLLAIAIVTYAYARTLPAIPGQEYGAAVFPMLVAAGLAGCGVLLIASGLRHWQGAVIWDDWARKTYAWARVAVVFAMVLIYILAAPAIGFVPMSIVILLVFMVMMGVRWWIAAGVALVATVMIQHIFGLLRVPLPLGLLGP